MSCLILAEFLVLNSTNWNLVYIIDKIVDGAAADKVGLQRGDQIVKIDDIRVETLTEFKHAISIVWGVVNWTLRSLEIMSVTWLNSPKGI
jgi:hypothetical protein